MTQKNNCAYMDNVQTSIIQMVLEVALNFNINSPIHQ
jgi:hypothetical protein